MDNALRPMAVEVCWWDGKTETFNTAPTGLLIGKDALTLTLADGTGRHIPLRNVRWYDYQAATEPTRTAG